jgi:hypothetical protein
MWKTLTLAGIVLSISLSNGSAAVVSPQAAAVMADVPEAAESVAWVCGPRRCVWRPGWRGVVPRWAVWGPPRLPGCFYERRSVGWVEVCPI